MVCSFTVRAWKRWVPGTVSYQQGQNQSNQVLGLDPATLLDMKETSGNWWDALGWGRWGGRSRARQDGQASVSVTPPEWAIRAPRCRPGALMTAVQWGISAEQLTSEGLTAKNAISSNSGRKKNITRRENWTATEARHHGLIIPSTAGVHTWGEALNHNISLACTTYIIQPIFVQSAFSISSRFCPA